MRSETGILSVLKMISISSGSTTSSCRAINSLIASAAAFCSAPSPSSTFKRSLVQLLWPRATVRTSWPSSWAALR